MRQLGVYENVVKAVPQPEFTPSWHPVSHARVLDALEREVTILDMNVVKRDYTLTKTGNRMFGVWTLDGGEQGTRQMLGIRNSIDKSMSVGICAGTHVTVCSNMMFDGEFIRFRKHTGGLDDGELREIAYDALRKSITMLGDLLSWHMNLKHYWLTNENNKTLTYDAMDKGAINPSRFKDFVECLELEQEMDTTSLYAWHGAVTRLMKDESFFNISRKSKVLKRVVDDYLEKCRVR